MKTNDLLNELSQNISDSYDVVEAGGGAMPSDRITWNLANAIRTIPEPVPPVPPIPPLPPTDILYGKVGTYPWTEEESWSGDGVEINSIDQETLDDFLAEHPSDSPEFTYEMDWESETPEENYIWWFYWEEGELKIQPEDFTATTGIDCTVEQGADWAYIYYERNVIVDTEGEITYREYASLEEFNIAQGEYLTIDGDSVYRNAICSIETGSEITALPNYFASGMQNLTHIDLTHSPIDTIGNYCIQSLNSYNEPFEIPPRLTTIPNYFMNSLPSFNQPVFVPYRVTTIGNGFLQACKSLNSTVTLPRGMQTIGNQFMNVCTAFNQQIEIPSTVTSIGSGFLANCGSFNQPVTLPQGLTSLGESFISNSLSFNQPITVPSGVTVINNRFLQGCKSLNQPVTLHDDIESIGAWFLNSCSVFNQPIHLPKKAELIGDYFMNECQEFNSTLTMPEEVTTIGSSFLAYCKKFNKSIALPNTLTTIRFGFLSQCDEFNKHITIPSSVTSIGAQFLYRCPKFAAGVTCGCPATVFGTVTNAFIVNSFCDCSRLGVPLDGTYAIQWQQKFPYTFSSSQQRKTYVEKEVPVNKLYLVNGTEVNLTASDIPSLCLDTSVATVTIDGVTFNLGEVCKVDISNLEVDTIPRLFLSGCKTLKKLVLPASLVTIGEDFLRNCEAFNYPIILPEGLENIQSSFMYGCLSYNQNLTLPTTIKYAHPNYYAYFLYGCDRMTSTLYCNVRPGIGETTPDRTLACGSATSPMYVEGVKLAGPYAQEWKNKYVDLSSGAYRKLILAS